MKSHSYQGKKIVIFGLGRYEHGSGIAAVKFFIDQGADLHITDLQAASELAVQIDRVKQYAEDKKYEGQMTWRMGEHQGEDLVNADLVIFNQAIPVTSEWVRFVKEKGIPFDTEMGLFFDLCPAKIIGITGTRGKSTTTALIHHILSNSEKKVHMGGNITHAALELLPAIQKDDWVVLELSNFMLEYLNLKEVSPHIAVLLNVLPDHLSRYNGDMEAYAGVKEVITKYQGPEDLLICNQQNTYTNKIGGRSQAKVIWYDSTENTTGIDLEKTNLLGMHNRENLLAAITCVKELHIPNDVIESALQSFTALKGRLQFVEDINGVTFINDTTSTTPVAAIAALEALRDRPIILIAGGADKGLGFQEFVQELSTLKSVVLLPGKGTDRIKSEIAKQELQAEIIDAASMEEAVKLAYSRSQSGDMILLSPACSSFGLFKNEFDRGDQFNQQVAELKQ